MSEEIRCPKCGSRKTHKFGIIPTVHEGKKQRYRCRNCGRTFY